MFARNAEPIANVPVYKRIDLNPRYCSQWCGQYGCPCGSRLSSRGPATWEICDALMRKHEGERIWALIKQTAEGTNAPAVAQSEYQAPDEDCA